VWRAVGLQTKGRAPTASPFVVEPRPPPAELAMGPEFREVYSRIWSDLKDEVAEFR
jgi:hypothetical protein